MPFRYLDDIATADVAFEAWGASIEEMFVAAADAALGVMVEHPDTIESREEVTLRLSAGDPEMLLFEFLQELIYYKDARRLLLRATAVSIDLASSSPALSATVRGEVIDHGRHPLLTDVKAVTLHRFSVRGNEQGWKATVVLDV